MKNTNSYLDKYNEWMSSSLLDESMHSELSKMPDSQRREAFSSELEFGTGGLRGIMGLGTSYMNIFTIRRATMGLARYIIDEGQNAVDRGVVIAYDSRNNSELFARHCASVLCEKGIKNYIFDSLRPTPMLSFAVRELGCFAGIVITASHNPKEYNGYKVYGEDGGQLPPNMASKILSYINSVDMFSCGSEIDISSTVIIGEKIDNAYMEAVVGESLGEKIPDDFTVVYTPLHGSGNLPVRRILDKIGVKRLFVVKEQELPNGDFPTVKSPNPENKEAFDIAIEYAKNIGADIIIGTDPDSDRIGVVVPLADGGVTVLNGNQTGVILSEYILRKQYEAGMPPQPKVVKTIVTTDMVNKIAESYGAKTVDVLTGFKYIGDKIKEYESTNDTYLFGMEESYGYLKGTYARDKDAVVAAMLICQVASECRSEGINLAERLENLYKKYGYYRERLISYTFNGLAGIEKIKEIMSAVRVLPVQDGEVERIDYSCGIDGLPPSDVIKFIFNDGWLCARPSGTEPKIKFYLSARGDSVSACETRLDTIEAIVRATVGE